MTGQKIVPTGRHGGPFTGYKIRTYAGAIHALVRFAGPLTASEILEKIGAFEIDESIGDIPGRIKSHLRFWAKKGVYCTDGEGRYSVNPDVAWSPEWQTGLSRARSWYEVAKEKMAS